MALKNGIIKNDPFQEYQIKLKQTNRTFLTIDEVKSIMKQELPYERLELVRDLFLFAVFTGIAFVDVKNLSKSHLHTAVDGHQWLRFERWKTKEMSNIRLFEVPARLIEKYSDPKRETLFPMLSNQKVNQYLKEIAEVCGVEKRITYHCGRHTMATTIALSNGMPMESLAKLL
ncbi:site-specific integrase [Proteiniphilum sp. UBA5384]|uniref:site-specific integrase n=1 Tax=Proteiniphilum sp. UBA5384 TaxID=1947279 RepID=UPI0032E4E550